MPLDDYCCEDIEEEDNDFQSQALKYGEVMTILMFLTAPKARNILTRGL